MNACGGFGQQHAPPPRVSDVLTLLRPGHCFAFSLNDDAYQDQGGACPKRVDALAKTRAIDILEMAYGDPLPGNDLKAWVYGVRKIS